MPRFLLPVLLAGIVIGLLIHWPAGERFVRICGGLVACIGAYFLVRCLAG